MDQKNTIVQCNATTCLYNHKGICDQYVIDLDMYGQCKDCCECEKTEAPAQLKSDLEYNKAKELLFTPENIGTALKLISQKLDEEREANLLYDNAKKMLEKAGVTLIEPKGEVKRGKRAELPILADGVPQDIVDVLLDENLITPDVAKEVTTGEESQTCVDCGHFDDTGLLQCWCKEIQQYSHRKNNPCEAFVERAKYNKEIKPHKGKLNECWWCDYHVGLLGGKKKCQLLHPDIRDGKCYSIKSTGANQ